MKTGKWNLRVIAMTLTAVMGIIEPAGLAYAGELSDPAELTYVGAEGVSAEVSEAGVITGSIDDGKGIDFAEEIAEKISNESVSENEIGDPQEPDPTPKDEQVYIPTEKAKIGGFRIDKVEVGSYSVKVTFTMNKDARKTAGINTASLCFLYTDIDDPAELGKDDMRCDKRRVMTDNGFVVGSFKRINSVNNPDGTVTFTMMIAGDMNPRINKPLVPGKKYYWRMGYTNKVTRKSKDRQDREYDKNYPYEVVPVLEGYYSLTMGEGVEETKVSIDGSPEVVSVGATAAELKFKVNNPANEELISTYLTYTASGGWEGSASARLHDDGYYHAFVTTGTRTVDVKSGVLVRTGLSETTIKENRFVSDGSVTVTPLKLSSDNVKYRISADKEDDRLIVHAYAEVDSVMPVDDLNITMSTSDAKAKVPSDDEDADADEIEYGYYTFNVIQSTDSPTGWKAVSEDAGELCLLNVDKANVKLVISYSSDMTKDSGEETVEDSPVYLVNKTISCGVTTYVSSIRFKNESVELPQGTAYTLEAEITPGNATDKTLEYTSSDPSVATVSSTGVVSAKNAGTTVITAKAADGSGVESSNSVTVTVVAAEEEDEPEEDEPEVPEEDKEDENYSEDNIWVTAIDDSGIFYTGKAVKPAVRVYDGNLQLAEKVDYTLTYKNNVKVYETEDGKFDERTAPTVIVKLKGDYSGEKKIFFNIHASDTPAVSVAGAEVVWPDGKSEFDYRGRAICPKPGLKADGNELEAGKDFTISYQNNTKAGKATLIFTGQGKCTGEKKVQFTIKALNLNDSNVKVNGGSKSILAVYSAGGTKPALKVTYGEGDDAVILKEGVDYKISYANNKEVTTEKTKRYPTANLSGIGCCTGKLPVQFKILQCDFATGVTISADDKAEGKKANQYSTKIKVTDKSGSVLRAGKDYEKTIVYYAYDPETGIKGNRLDKTSWPKEGDVICAEVTGKGNYSNEKAVGYYRILKAGNDISKAKVKIVDQTIAGNGKAVTIPEDDKQFSVVIGSQILHLVADEAEDGFMIVPGSYVNNTKKGTAKVTLRGTGSFGGTKTVSFKIVPKLMPAKLVSGE